MSDTTNNSPDRALGRRDLLRTGGGLVALGALGGLIAACAPPAPAQPTAAPAGAAPAAAPAAASSTVSLGPKRKIILVPQDAGDWNAPARVGCRDFCQMNGWEFQHLGNPVYSVENHVEQVNNAIAAKPDVIITSLESVGIVPAFQKAQQAGILMIIFDQGIEAEASKLGVPIVNQDEYNAGVINGTQAATTADKVLGKKTGVFGVGNGNPGSTSIDKRQNGTKQGIDDYNKANGTTFTTDLFPDDEFFDINSSVQKWGAKLDQYGDKMVGMIGVGNATALVKAAQAHNIEKGKIVIGSTDANPDHVNLIDQGWMFWAIDQQFVAMGFLASSLAFLDLNRGFTFKQSRFRTGGEVVTKENLAAIKKRTDDWVALAKQYGDMK